MGDLGKSTPHSFAGEEFPEDDQAQTPKVLPTVFKWDGGGKNVYITGTFSNWKTIPMVKRYFVNYLLTTITQSFPLQSWGLCNHR